MRKLTLFVASLLVSVASFAQWTKPTAPAVTPMVVGEECYLYNRDADGFLVGANDWGTRASVNSTGDIDFQIAASGTGYTLDSQISNGGESHFRRGLYLVYASPQREMGR